MIPRFQSNSFVYWMARTQRVGCVWANRSQGAVCVAAIHGTCISAHLTSAFGPVLWHINLVVILCKCVGFGTAELALAEVRAPVQCSVLVDLHRSIRQIPA